MLYEVITEIIQADGPETLDLELALFGADEVVFNHFIGFLAQRDVHRFGKRLHACRQVYPRAKNIVDIFLYSYNFV